MCVTVDCNILIDGPTNMATSQSLQFIPLVTIFYKNIFINVNEIL